jgi:hypothetical protein
VFWRTMISILAAAGTPNMASCCNTRCFLSVYSEMSGCVLKHPLRVSVCWTQERTAVYRKPLDFVRENELGLHSLSLQLFPVSVDTICRCYVRSTPDGNTLNCGLHGNKKRHSFLSLKLPVNLSLKLPVNMSLRTAQLEVPLGVQRKYIA